MENNLNTIQKEIEAILFYLSEPLSYKRLAEILEVEEEKIYEAVKFLKNNLSNRGIELVQHEDEVSLVTSPQVSKVIDKIVQDEQKRDIGKAGIETLSIILYKGNITRREIEYIRGVNSQFALRNLLIRGLIYKKTSPNDERVMVYGPTIEALTHLGIKNIEELPEYDKVNKQTDVPNIEQNQEN